MSSHEESATYAELRQCFPGECNCSGVDGVVNVLGRKVDNEEISLDDATLLAGRLTDKQCSGKIKDPNPLIVGCGSPEKICGHRGGKDYLNFTSFRILGGEIELVQAELAE